MAAKAPRPGSTAHERGARQFIRLKVREFDLDVMPALTMKERFVVRAATATAFEAFLPAQTEREIGEDSLFVLWWVGRRQNGEPNLPFAQAEREWPAEFGPDDLDFTIVDLDAEPEADDSPESSGPDSSMSGPTSSTSSESTPGTTSV